MFIVYRFVSPYGRNHILAIKEAFGCFCGDNRCICDLAELKRKAMGIEAESAKGARCPCFHAGGNGPCRDDCPNLMPGQRFIDGRAVGENPTTEAWHDYWHVKKGNAPTAPCAFCRPEVAGGH